MAVLVLIDWKLLRQKSQTLFVIHKILIPSLFISFFLHCLLIKLEIASLDMPPEQPPRETPQLKCQGVGHQDLYLEQCS